MMVLSPFCLLLLLLLLLFFVLLLFLWLFGLFNNIINIDVIVIVIDYLHSLLLVYRRTYTHNNYTHTQ